MGQGVDGLGAKPRLSHPSCSAPPHQGGMLGRTREIDKKRVPLAGSRRFREGGAGGRSGSVMTATPSPSITDAGSQGCYIHAA